MALKFFPSLRLVSKILKCVPKNTSYSRMIYSYRRMYSNYAVNSVSFIRNSDHFYLNDFQKYFCSKVAPKVCWRCNNPLEKIDIFCSSCNVIQHIENVNNYFTVLGIPESYKIDLTELSQKFKYLQTRLHPDKFSNSSDEEKKISEEWSMAVNKAHDVIKNPLKRGLHILKLHNESIDDVKMEPEFLAHVMQLHEEAEAAWNLPEITKLYEVNNKIMDTYIEQIITAFDEKNIQKAKHLLAEMKYYESIQNDLKEKLQNFHENHEKS